MRQLFLLFFYLCVSDRLYGSSFGKQVYSCSGFSDEDSIGEADIEIAILKRRTAFFANIKIGSSEQSMVQIWRRNSEEVSFSDSFFNRAQKMELQVFLDDMGSMSSLRVEAQRYYLTCSEF